MPEEPAPGLIPLVQSIHERIRGTLLRPDPGVAFYPYTAAKSTIRLREGRVLIRLSDHLRDAPDTAIRGVVSILLVRLFRLSEGHLDPEEVRAYRSHVDSDHLKSRRKASAETRGRKHIDPVGDHRSLLESFLRVNMDMDLVLPDAPKLSWSRTRSRRRFGHHDADHGVIVLSRVLDDPGVPEFVLDFVVYHELLHIIHPPMMGSGGKRMIHHRAFREAEAKFEKRAEAEVWLQRLASVRKRR